MAIDGSIIVLTIPVDIVVNAHVQAITGTVVGGVCPVSTCYHAGRSSADQFVPQAVVYTAMLVIAAAGTWAILGSIVLVVLPEILRPVADYRMLFYGLLLILVMTTRPQGLWPSKQRKRELLERTGV